MESNPQLSRRTLVLLRHNDLNVYFIYDNIFKKTKKKQLSLEARHTPNVLHKCHYSMKKLVLNCFCDHEQTVVYFRSSQTLLIGFPYRRTCMLRKED